MSAMLNRSPEYRKVQKLKIYRKSAAWEALIGPHDVKGTPTFILMVDGEETDRMRGFGFRKQKRIAAMYRKALEAME